MNKKLILIIIFLIPLSLLSQVRRPKKSFFQNVEQRVGLTDVKLNYYRPSMKGRAIFGSLEKYGEIWRTGANKNTIITFSENVEIDGKELKAGSYALYTKPNIESWDVFFYTDIENWGVPKVWDNNKVALKITIPVFKLNRDIETLTINIDNIKESSANLGIMWERTYISIPIEFHFKELLERITKKELRRNAIDFHIAAVNYHERGYDLEQAKRWMEQAISLKEKPHFWDYREYSIILSKLKKYKEAIIAAKKCIQLSKKLGDNGNNAINLSKKSIKEWQSKI
ncbi:DUF2911 domain-containing protein [Tenacibaculum ovolyticum]|uniref:DUF2911 domain-containing protein n=1 Tax=Tenacibaculum ovolyticum TaxID=104270 RepID=UPI0007EE1F99|nr:DUF2911 domain-containing protein [Tenacibaculum ovolyticum]